MPAQQGLGLDEEAPSLKRRKKSVQPGEHGPVSRPKCRARHLAAQDGNLVAEHDELDC